MQGDGKKVCESGGDGSVKGQREIRKHRISAFSQQGIRMLINVDFIRKTED